MKRYLGHIVVAVIAISVLWSCEITFKIVAEQEQGRDTIPKITQNIPENIPAEFGPTRIKLRQLERADSVGQLVFADSLLRAHWSDSLRYYNGKLIINGDTARVVGDGIICTGSLTEMLNHYPPSSDSCQMFLIDSTNLLFNYSVFDSTWHSVYQDLIIVRDVNHGRTHAPALGAYFDENTGHWELSRGDSLPTHVYLSLDPALPNLDWYIVASAGRYPKRLFQDWPTLADSQYYYKPDPLVGNTRVSTPTEDSLYLFRQEGDYIYVNIQSSGGVAGGSGSTELSHQVTVSSEITNNISTYGFSPASVNGSGGYFAANTAHYDSLYQFYIGGYTGGKARLIPPGPREITATFMYSVNSVYYVQDDGTLATSADSDGDSSDYISACVYVIASLGSDQYIVNFFSPLNIEQ